jgi:hypothetical protein
MTLRKIVVHIHLFKNAGTSVDNILKRNFGPRWMSHDDEVPGHIICANQFNELVRSNPAVEAFSSHQVVPPLPDDSISIFPIVFIRHPIERVLSAYNFEWKTQKGLCTPEGELGRYIEEKMLKKRRNIIENFQTFRLSNTNIDRFHNVDKFDDYVLLDQAKEFIKKIPCIGIVDRFDQSIRLIQECANVHWPKLDFTPVHENISQNSLNTVEEKLDYIQDILGPASYHELIEANNLDLELYKYANELLDNQSNAVYPNCVVG